MEKIKGLILQKIDSYEIRVCLQAAMLADDRIPIIRSSFEDLDSYTEFLKNQYMPVGSVEFIHKALGLINKKIPDNLSYPKELEKYLNRKICALTKSDFMNSNNQNIFIKPQKTKLFTGFCFDKQHEEYENFMKISNDEWLWCSEIIEIEQEWRYYIQNNKIIGKEKYIESADKNVDMDSFVKNIINDYNRSMPYTIDVGNGNNINYLIECNDAYAIGLYYNAMKPKEYLSFLHERWMLF